MSSSENDSEEEVLQPGEEDDEEEGKGDGEENLGLIENKESNKVKKF